MIPNSIGIRLWNTVADNIIVRVLNEDTCREVIWVNNITASDVDNAVVLDQILGLGTSFEVDRVSYDVIHEVVFNLKEIGQFQSNCSVERVMDRIFPKIGAMEVLNMVHSDRVAINLLALSSFREFDIRDSEPGFRVQIV